MKKILLIIITILILLLCFYPFTFATNSEINMNLSANNADTNINASSNTETTIPAENSNNFQTPVTTTSPQNFFTADNILIIILITVGIVLILLGFAIFFRTK